MLVPVTFVLRPTQSIDAVPPETAYIVRIRTLDRHGGSDIL